MARLQPEDTISEVIELAMSVLENGVPDTAEAVNRLTAQIAEDLAWLAGQDPAAGSEDAVNRLYESFRVVAYYRLCRLMWLECGREEDGSRGPYRDEARKVMESIKSKTGVEIHPGASIGCPFAIDHGSGTVIGETVEIGHRCYLLNGVILGSRTVTGQGLGKRHPSLGDDVRIAAHAGIYGPIRIGNGVKVGAFAQVFQDIRDGSTVSVVTRTQVLTASVDEPPAPSTVRPSRLRCDRPTRVVIAVEGTHLGDVSQVVLHNWGRQRSVWEVASFAVVDDRLLVCEVDLVDGLHDGVWDLHAVSTGGSSGVLTGAIRIGQG